MSAVTTVSPPQVDAVAPMLVSDGSEFRAKLGSISRQSFVYFAGTVLTAAAGYFFKIYLARKLGAEALGLYALGMTIIGFIGIFNSLGLPAAATRFVAAYSARGERWKLIPFISRGILLLGGLNVLLGAVVLVLGPWLVTYFYHAPKLNRYLWAFVLIMVLGVLNLFLAQVMAGYRDVARRTLITHFIGTPTNIVLAILLITLGFGLAGYMASQVVSAVLVFVLLGYAVCKLTPSTTSRANFYFEREVVSFSVAAYGIAGLQFALSQTDLIVLGHYLDAKHVGVYAVAMALVGFVSIGLDSVNQIFSPVISELHSAGNTAVLQQLYSVLTKWILAVTFPLAVTLVLFAHGLMAVFGSSFQSGAAVVIMGTVGQIFNCAVGSVGYLLLMSGHEAELVRIQAVNAVALLALNFALVPRLGIAGAALATTITAITTNVWGLASVRRLLKVFPYQRGYLRLVAPALGSAGAIFVLSRVFADVHKQWEVAAVGLFVAYVIFGVIMALIGLDPDDQKLAKLAWTRVGQSFRRMAVAQA